jgi:pimeloyl-ACP methyl ester carboxylesterase
VNKIEKNRLKRFTQDEKSEYKKLLIDLAAPNLKNKNTYLQKLKKLTGKSDNYELLNEAYPGKINLNSRIFQSIWEEASALRKSGRLLEIIKKINCPVTAIHGDYDPHPAEGVKKPLESIINDFKFILLKNCGHSPWQEKYAQNEFYMLLINYIK